MSDLKSIPEAIQHLPIADVVDQVNAALKDGNVALHAEPGAGKSTGLPLALLASATPSNKIVMLEPRRLAAIGVAERLASQLSEPLGQRVGLRMRGQTSVSGNTCLEVVTEGVLTRMLQADPTLDGIGLIIFDEFHERSLHADLGLALSLEVQQALREDLRLLLMSATLDAVQISAGLGSIKQISCAGRQHPVAIRWLGNGKEELPLRVASAVSTALSEEHGDVLVFLPGIAEIERTARILEPRLTDSQLLYRLHGRAEAKIQRAATAPATPHKRRIILSTSVAETSITIDGVRVVIDAGLERRAREDSRTGSERLETVMASQASATQRAGRAGRTSAGMCYRLWSQSDHARRAVSWQAEILRAELSSLVMELGVWGATDIAAVPWLEPPPSASIDRAKALLTNLGLWKDGRLSDHGIVVAKLPVHPRLGHMLVWAAQRKASFTACKLAVLLEDGGLKSREANVELLIQQVGSQHQKRRISQLQKLVGDYVVDPKAIQIENEATPSIAVLLAQAYPDWIAQHRAGDEAKYALSCGAGAFMDANDPLSLSKWIAVASMGGASREARVFLASALDIDELESWAPELFSNVKKLEWDDRVGRVVAEQQKMLGALVVEASTITDITDDEKAQALLSGVRKRGISCLPWNDECREWQARVKMMARLSGSDSNASGDHVSAAHTSDGDWPEVDDEALSNTLENWLLVWLNGMNSLKAVAQLDLLAILKAMLTYQQQTALDALLPVRYTVPSGSNIKLRYASGEIPVLAVKLQEMFGCTENPSIANGQIVLKVELLSPAQRPVQLTADLVNFWSNSYPAVKKDMAGRYPKHDWPDNPLTAKPTAYAKRRKK